MLCFLFFVVMISADAKTPCRATTAKQAKKCQASPPEYDIGSGPGQSEQNESSTYSDLYQFNVNAKYVFCVYKIIKQLLNCVQNIFEY